MKSNEESCNKTPVRKEEEKNPDNLKKQEEIIPETSKKEPYRATFTFYPQEPGPSWKDSIPQNNVSRKKFELECLNLQMKSREELAKRRSNERNARKSKLREEPEMSTNEMFLKLMEKLDERSDGIEDKLSLQDEKIENLDKTVNPRISKLEEEVKTKEVDDKRKIEELEKRVLELEQFKATKEAQKVRCDDIGPENAKEGEPQRTFSESLNPQGQLQPLQVATNLLQSVSWPSLPSSSNNVFRPPPLRPQVPQPSSVVHRNAVPPNLPVEHFQSQTEYRRPPKRTKEEYLSSPKKESYATPEEEALKKFEKSKSWAGIKLKEGEVQKHMWGLFGSQTEQEVLFGIQNKKAREDCIKLKIEIFCSIHVEDIEIFYHYVTTSNGVILWFQTQDYIAKEIYRVGPKVKIKFTD